MNLTTEAEPDSEKLYGF